MIRMLVTVGRAALAALLVVAPAAAQTVNVTVLGVVVDQSRAAIPGATITVTNTETGLTRQSVSDAEGRYSIGNLPAGTYDVQAELQGFTTQVHRQQVLHVGTTITFDFALSVGTISETIEVKGDAPVLETTKNTLSRIVQPKELDTLPVISRSFSELAQLAPGVVRTSASRSRAAAISRTAYASTASPRRATSSARSGSSTRRTGSRNSPS
jgi:hypothetical protein